MYVDLIWVRLEIIERDHYNGLEPQVDYQLKMRCSVFRITCLKLSTFLKVAVSILLIFSSRYSCKLLFSAMNLRNQTSETAGPYDGRLKCIVLCSLEE